MTGQNLGSEVQWNGYAELSITVPLRPRPQLRFVTLGMGGKGRILLAVWTLRGDTPAPDFGLEG